MNNPQLRATPEHFTLTAATKLQVSSSSQSSPHVRSSPAYLVNNPRFRTNSGKQDGRYFNNRGGERGRRPLSFQSCEHTDQKAAQVASDHAHGDQAEGGQKKSKVDQTQIRVVHSQNDLASKRREEAGKLQEDRSKAVIAKAIAEAT